MLGTFEKLTIYLAEKWGAQTRLSRFLYLNKIEMLYLPVSFPKKKPNHTIARTEKYLNHALTQNEVEAGFAETSMLPVVPIISKFPLMGIYQCMDVLRIFKFETMNCVLLVL